MIRFSAALVAVAIGVLIGGIATSNLLLVYIAIAVSAVALLALAAGVVLKREELFGEGQGLVPAGAGAPPVQSARTGESQDQPKPVASVPPPAPFQGLAAGHGSAFDGTPFGGTSQAAPPLTAPPPAAKPPPALGPGQNTDPEPEPVLAHSDPSSADPSAAATADGLVAVLRGVPRYHQPDCVLIRFMPESDVQRLPAAQAKADGCTPCAACQPASHR